MNQTASDSSIADTHSEEPAPSQTGAKPTEAADQTDKDKPKDEKHHDGAIVVAPLPIVSPEIGAGIIPVLSYIFPVEEKDKNSPPSVVGGAGLITDNGSRGFGVGGDVFLKEDRYELRSFYAHGNINYDLYGVGYVNGNSSVKLPLKQTGQIFFVEFLRNKIFVGPRFVNGNSFITVNTTDGPASKIPPDVGLTPNCAR